MLLKLCLARRDWLVYVNEDACLIPEGLAASWTVYWPRSGYEPGKLGSNLDWTLSPGSGSGIMLDWTWITVRVHRLAGPGLQVPNQVHRGGGAERGLKNHTGKFTCSCTKMSVMR